MNRLESSDT